MLAQSIVAVAVDILIGEPPLEVHPTVRMGNLIKRFTPAEQPRIKPRSSSSVKARNKACSISREKSRIKPCCLSSLGISRKKEELIRGAALELGGIFLSIMFGTALKRLSRLFPLGVQPFIEGYFLKHSLAIDALLSAAIEVENALKANDLVEARRLLAWHLVSRDTSRLSEAEVIGATIESIAENLSDSFVAPLFMYRVGGLSAAFAYRFINTADAMLGYRNPKFEYFGKSAAIADDIANIVPSRLTALCIALASGILGHNFRSILFGSKAEASRTSSPNAGWPMGAMALALNCKLTKRNSYVLNKAGESPTIESLEQARKITALASALAVAIICGSSMINCKDMSFAMTCKKSRKTCKRNRRYDL